MKEDTIKISSSKPVDEVNISASNETGTEVTIKLDRTIEMNIHYGTRMKLHPMYFSMKGEMPEISEPEIQESEELEMPESMLRQLDSVDNAVYEACLRLLSISAESDDFPWDMQILTKVRKAIEYELVEHGRAVCYPYISHNQNGSSLCIQDECGCSRCVRDNHEQP